MAGHPTIGSTFALAAEGTIARGTKDFVFELGIGPTPVSLEWKDDALSFAWMTQQLPTVRRQSLRDRQAPSPCDRRERFGSGRRTARAGRVVRRALRVRAALTSREAVDSVSIDRRSAGALRASRKRRRRTASVLLHRRRQAGAGCGADGVQPDAGALVRSWRRSGDRRRQRTARLLSAAAQGRHAGSRTQHPQPAGRPDEAPKPLHISIDSDGPTITRVRVGGRSVLVGHGVLTLNNA